MGWFAKNRGALIPIIILVVVIIGAGVGGYILYNNAHFYSTDDAQVTGNIVNVVPRISGTLVNLNVQVGDTVSARQVIGTVRSDNQISEDHLTAPFDGVIVQVPGVIGQTVTTATAVAQETDLKGVKVTAYVDETALKTVAVGQAVDIHVDANNSDFTGHVTQIVSASAGQFSLLPSQDNSSGNFTKVSQRFPVYIYPDQDLGQSLLPGMSVEVKIHLL